VGEFELIARLAAYLDGDHGPVALGFGDDAAVVVPRQPGVAVAVDVVVEGVHFRRDLSSLADAGWKAMVVNLSDLAAMAARPLAAVVGLCRPAAVDAGEVEDLYRGMRQACDRWNLALVGGDTVAGQQLVVSVTVLGDVDPQRALRRSGARPGDQLVLVGSLGAAAAALATVEAGAAPEAGLLAAHRRPRALVAAGRILADQGAHAAIDVSDGLGADLGHLCAASGVRARVDAAHLPLADGVAAAAHAVGADPVLLACGGGEDFALLAAVPAHRAAAAATAAGAAEGVAAAVIGEILEAGRGPLALLRGDDGRELELDGLGYDHYRRPPPTEGIRP
jgi:thiamine-monophosphate kinase